MSVIEQALRLTKEGISVIPIRPDGTKAPAVREWKPYQKKIANPGELEAWFRNGNGIAMIAGEISGNLEMLDFDDPDAFDSWTDLLKKDGNSQLLEKLPVVMTPTGGFHVYYRCEEPVEGNQKLAQKHGPDGQMEVMIETRGEGGYVVAPGSPRACHSSGKPYRLVRGDLTNIPRITAEERTRLLDAARSLNEIIKPKRIVRGPSAGVGNRPGDDFNQRGTWEEILTPHGWEPVRHRGETTDWRRPGKGHGFSATTNHGGSDLFYCFSSNGHPFEPETAYSKFAAYTLLNHNNDFKAAARALASEGYGEETASVVNVVNVVTSEGITQPKKWPKMAEEAFQGLVGEYVRAIEPHTESDTAALLVQFLIFYGNVIGKKAHFRVESDRHHLNLFAVLVGRSSKGRKGTALGHIRTPFTSVDECWIKEHIAFGLSSGEGLIWAVRDPIEKQEPIKVKGRVEDYQTVVTDPGVEDKRLLVIESEFASTLRVMGRDGNILSAVIRNAWDSGNLRTLTKNSPARATDAHISIIGHITTNELLRYLDSTEAGNGFGNRFLWLCVKRSKALPEGGKLHEVDLGPLVRRLFEAVGFGRSAGEIHRDDQARQIWAEIYSDLSEGKPGLLGAMIARGEAQVMRLASLYALLDCSVVICKQHLHAAMAVWDYAEASCEYIFGSALGDPIADQILVALRRAGEVGCSRTEIRDLFKRNKTAEQIDRALSLLSEQDLATCEKTETGGRPTERWFITR